MTDNKESVNELVKESHEPAIDADDESVSEHVRLSRRLFLGSTGALVGAASVGLGSSVLSSEASAAGAGHKTDVGPGELDEYYGFWSGGHSEEKCAYSACRQCEN